MSRLRSSWTPSRSRLRQVAWLAALALAAAALWLHPSPVSLLLEVAGALVFAVGTLWPGWVHRVLLLPVSLVALLVRLVGGGRAAPRGGPGRSAVTSAPSGRGPAGGAGS